jgi:hypothetical protein
MMKQINMLKARSKLESFVKQASAFETKVNIIATIDYNVASGIARIAKEIMADIIVLGWPRKVGLIDKIVGEKVNSVLNNTDKSAYLCHLERPLELHKRIVVVTPPLAEHEKGFEHWLIKVSKLAQEFTLNVDFYCDTITEKAIGKAIQHLKLNGTFQFKLFTDWEEFLILAREINKDDLFILISARHGAPSHMNVLDNLPNKLEKHFVSYSRIIIYPQLYNQNHVIERFEDISAEPLTKGIETIQRLGKRIGGMFKSDDELH